ncbi:MAG: citrate/2-methylcitrate synthase [Clostridiales bacterium]|nr:citrate/2-methylcitrate synthase [Clostridiales bacterium]
MNKFYSGNAPELEKYKQLCVNGGGIDPELYTKYSVNRGLRDLNGKGVLTGLTEISDVHSKDIIDGKEVPCEGRLFYRGYDVKDIIKDIASTKRFGFEETAYILLFGSLPAESELDEFKTVLANYRLLPGSFVRDFIMKAPSDDIMNSLARSVLALYSYDENPNDTSVGNVLRQCIRLISLFPLLSVYGYQAYNYYIRGNQSFFIHEPKHEYSTAENILYMLRLDGKFTPLEAQLLDLALILHAEHGGGNNSTFTTHVVTSSGTDTYSAIAAALGSLKGPRHGGANIKVRHMFMDMKSHIEDWDDDEEIMAYLMKLLNKETFDRSGLIYGIGHAVYSLSDPRAEIFKGFVERLAAAKGLSDEYRLYANVERLAPEAIAKKRRIYKGVSANVDFYSGFVYDMLGIPEELYTPIFADARIVGWSAHRLEEIINSGKIIRPAYKNVQAVREYIPLDKRN